MITATELRDNVKERWTRVQDNLKSKTTIEGWILPRQTGSFADEGAWYLTRSIQFDTVMLIQTLQVQCGYGCDAEKAASLG
jgi:hypothetical protein